MTKLFEIVMIQLINSQLNEKLKSVRGGAMQVESIDLERNKRNLMYFPEAV